MSTILNNSGGALYLFTGNANADSSGSGNNWRYHGSIANGASVDTDDFNSSFNNRFTFYSGVSSLPSGFSSVGDTGGLYYESDAVAPAFNAAVVSQLSSSTTYDTSSGGSNTILPAGDLTGPLLQGSGASVSISSDGLTVTFTFTEGMFLNSNGTGALSTTPGDYTIALRDSSYNSAGNASISAVSHTAGSADIAFTLSSNPGNTKYLNELTIPTRPYDQYGNQMSSSQGPSNMSVGSISGNKQFPASDSTAPTISSVAFAPSTKVVTVTFSEGVRGETGSAAALVAADLSLSIAGGVATSPSVASGFTHSGDASSLTFVLGHSGTISGREVLSIVPASSTSIYDAAGNAMSTSQSLGSVRLKVHNGGDLAFSQVRLATDHFVADSTSQAIKLDPNVLGTFDAAVVAPASDHFVFLDGGATGTAKTESIADLMALQAGTGLDVSSGAFELDLHELSAVQIASGDFVAIVDSTDNSTKKESIDDIATLFAGDGLSASSAVMALDLNELTAAVVDITADSIAIVDADDSNGSKKEAVADLISAMAGDGIAQNSSSKALELDVNELTAAQIASGDFIAFSDESESGDPTRKESIDDVAALFAGAGLTASSAVMAVGTSTNGGIAVAADAVSLDLSDLAAAVVDVANDSIAIIDANDSSASKKESIADFVGAMVSSSSGIDAASGVLSLDLNELSAATVNVAADSIAIIDADDSNASKKESISDLVSGIAGSAATTGLSASSGTLVVSDLHPVGVDGSANQLLTDDGDGTVTSEGNLSFDGSTLAVTGAATTSTTMTVGTDLTVTGGDIKFGNAQNATIDVNDVTGTDTDGKSLTLLAGAGTGTGAGGSIVFQVADGGSSSGGSVNAHATALTIADDKGATFAGAVTVTGNLTVNGDQFKVDGETVVVDDSLIEMGTVGKAAPTSTTTKDLGLLMHRHDGSDASLNFMGFGHDESAFMLLTGVTDDGDGTISGGSAGALQVGALTASGDITLSGADHTAAVIGDSLYFKDADGTMHHDSISDIMELVAGTVTATGIENTGGVLSVAIGSLDAEQIASGDFLAFSDTTDGGLHKESIDDIAALFAGAGLTASSAVMAVANATNGGIGVQANDIKVDLNDLAAAAVNVAADSIAIIDADDNGSKKESVADLITGVAGTVTSTGLAASSGVLSLAIHSLDAETIATGDKIAFADAGDNGLHSETIDDLFKIGPALVTEAAVAADEDYILFLDGGASGEAKKESIADLATAMAGNGLTASSGALVVGVDDSTIELSGDAVQLKNDGVTGAKISPNMAKLQEGDRPTAGSDGTYTITLSANAIGSYSLIVFVNGVQVQAHTSSPLAGYSDHYYYASANSIVLGADTMTSAGDRYAIWYMSEA